jgi:hypothetical protein
MGELQMPHFHDLVDHIAVLSCSACCPHPHGTTRFVADLDVVCSDFWQHRTFHFLDTTFHYHRGNATAW